MAEIRNGENVIAAVDDHELPGIVGLGYAPPDIILPAHHKACTVPSDHVGIAGAFCIIEA